MDMDAIIDADSKSVNALFQADVQYQVPLYQRRYIWDDESWKVLWKDILDQESKEVSAKAKHFTGPIVTRRVKRQEMRFEIIDGQQRLMTFQLIFCVIRDLCKKYGYCRLKEKSENHIRNGDIAIMGFSDRDPEEELPDPTYKFEVSKYDKSAFRAIKVEESEGNYGKNIHSAYDEKNKVLKVDGVNGVRSQIFKNDEKVSLNVLDAYDYFYEKIRNHIEGGSEEENDVEGFEEENKKKIKKKIDNLLEVIKFNFELVQITPGESQQAEEIFESVNATGRKLSEFDYLRNNLFLRASDESERFYTDYWIFEDDPDYNWNNNRLESFFQAFLIAKLGPDILENDAKLFDVYQQNLKEKNVENEFRELEVYAKTYKHLDNDNRNAHFKEQMQFYKDISTYYEENEDDYNSGIRLQHVHKITRVQALILHLVHKVEISDEDLEKIFKILESYTTRRLLVDTAIGTYAHARINDYFRALNEDKEFTIEHLVNFLLTRNKGPWISYNEVEKRFQQSGRREQGAGAYFQNSLSFAERYIFYRIENRMRKNEKESQLRFKDFPRTQERMLHSGKLKYAWASLGNATFCAIARTGSINNYNQEKSLLEKPDNNVLMLNQEICRAGEWNKDTIENREKRLLKHFCEMWPSADEFTKTAAQHSAKPKIISKPKVEPKWVSTIQSNFVDEPVRFFTYPEAKDLSQIRVTRDKVEGTDENGENQTLKKSNIFFVCSANDWPGLKYEIVLKTAVQAKKLQPILEPTRQLQLDNAFLQSASKGEVAVTALTRSGYEIQGAVSHIDEEAIYLQVKNSTLIVFRASLLEFGYDEWFSGYIKSFDPKTSCGIIELITDLSSIPTEIEFETGFPSTDIHSMNLDLNPKVNFNIRIVQKDDRSHFKAHNIKSITTETFYQGTIKNWLGSYGFIESSDFQKNIKFNRNALQDIPDRNLIEPHQKVKFETVKSAVGNYYIAINVQFID